MQTVQPAKRDFNLMRKIMLQIGTSFVPGQHFQLPPYPVDDPIVNLHVFFLKEEDMIRAYCDKDELTGQVPVSWIVDILPAGYDFLALIKDDNNWNAVINSFASAHKEPSFRTLIYALENIEEVLHLKDASSHQHEIPKAQGSHFVNTARIAELQAANSSTYDLTKLIQICLELNNAFTTESYISIIMLTRGLIDHVPPLFGATSFARVASSYGGTRSFKDSMQHLENSSRKIADQHLHSPIRKKEVLPNFTQVDFSNDIDVLLAEIVRTVR
jgi:hypothetical protein